MNLTINHVVTRHAGQVTMIDRNTKESEEDEVQMIVYAGVAGDDLE